jgi:outer membrane protein
MNTALRTRHIAGALLALGFAASAVPALAVQQGDWLIRGGVGHVAPTGESVTVPVVGGKVEADSATNLDDQPRLYDERTTWAWICSPRCRSSTTSTLAGAGKVGETKQLPPTLILFYNFAPEIRRRVSTPVPA